jgi:hypothetical protein
MIHKTVLAFVLSLALVLTPTLAHAQEGGGGGGNPLGTATQRAAAALTVIAMTTVFDQTARTMPLLNFATLLQAQQSRLIQGGPDTLSAINQLFAANQAAFVATVVLMMAMLRGACWPKAVFVPPKAAQAYSTGLAMMAFSVVAMLLLPYAIMTSYGKHGLASTQ